MKYTTARIAASRVEVGTVLYQGGAVKSVTRNTDGTVTITNQWQTMTVPNGQRLTYFPSLSRSYYGR
jgi:hypothetical protein